MGKVIFLLGAGASREAGFPLMAELTTGLRAQLAAFPEAADREQLLRAFDAAVARTAGPEGPPNVERVLQLLGDISVLKAGTGASVVQAWTEPFQLDNEGLEQLAALARDYIRDTLSATPPATFDYLHGIMDFAAEGPVDVFTLNYDRLVENMAVRFDVRYTTGFSEAWDPGLFDLPTLQLRIFKLHGSVDWYRLTDRNVVFRGAGTHPAFPGSPARGVLLYPTRGKTVFADPFATLVSFFNQTLSLAEFCVAIGYSFRDAHIRRILLDRMATNRDLQLLVVSPNPNEVMEMKPEEPGEPTFGQLTHRVSGLWMSASYALENGAVKHRLDEIRSVDRVLAGATSLLGERTRRADAARSILYAVELCRTKDLPHKPLPLLRMPFGAELRHEIGKQILEQLTESRAALRLDEPLTWQDVAPDATAVTVVQLLQLWLLAAGLKLSEEASAVQQALRTFAMQCIRGILFATDREYVVWGTPAPWRSPEGDTRARKDRIDACNRHISERPPMTGILITGSELHESYKSFTLGLQAMPVVYDRLFEAGLTVRRFGDWEAFTSAADDWANRSSIAAANLFASGLPVRWLGELARRTPAHP